MHGAPPSSETRAERPSEREVVFSRLLNAPRDVVWRMWSELQHVSEWYGPDGFTTTTHEFDFVPGGVWRHVMHGPDGTDYPTRVVFREIDAPSRIVYDNDWDLPGAPLAFPNVITFEPIGDKTALSIHMTFPNDEAMRVAVERYGVLHGGMQMLGRVSRIASTLNG